MLPRICLILVISVVNFGLAWHSVFASDMPPMTIKSFAADPPAAALAMQQRLYLAAQKQLHALLPLVNPWQEDESLLLMTESKSTEHYIRPNTGMIQAMAILYRFGPYDPQVTGISREKLLHEKLLPMMRYCLLTHKTGNRVTSDSLAWGDAWQSAHWANMLGNAAWLIWHDLPKDLQLRTRKLVAYEAERFHNATPPHRLRADTKAEENAWNSQILALAVVLMPQDERRASWEQAYQRWVLSSFLRPADAASQTVVDGKTVAEQFRGANVLNDFTLENHGFVHPDYMSTFGLTLGGTLAYRMTGRECPEALQYNVAPIYENLKWFSLPDGGRIYPNGQDWELFRNPGWVYTQLLMSVLIKDPDAWSLANESLKTLEKMQARHLSGEVIRDDETKFPSAKTGLFLTTAQSWLALALAREIPDNPRPKLGVLRLDDGKIVLHRTPKVVNSLSWGAKTMAMCVPYRLDRIISPDQRSGIGHIRLSGQDTPLQIETVEANVVNDEQSFSAKLVLNHGDQLIRAEIQVASNANGEFMLSERLVVLSDITTAEVATGLVGILNNPHWVYETGRRHLTVDKKEYAIEALSGADLPPLKASTIGIDGVLQVDSRRPLSIKYNAAKVMERGRATDMLYLNYHGSERKWREGEVISDCQIRIHRIGD